jgi:hypothetical protein
MYKIAFIISFISAASILFPFVGSILFWLRKRKENLDKEVIILSIYILIISFAQIAIVVFSFKAQFNHIIVSSFFPVQFSMFVYLVLYWFFKVKPFRSTISIFIFVLSYIVVIISKSENQYPIVLMLISSAVIIPLTFNSLIKMFEQEHKEYHVLMFKGILFCSFANLLMILFMKTFLHEASIMQSFFTILSNYYLTKTLLRY